MSAHHRPSTVIHIDRLTIQLNNVIGDAEEYTSRRNHPSNRRRIVSEVERAMRALAGPSLALVEEGGGGVDLSEEKEVHQEGGVAPPPPPLDEEKSRLSTRFPSLIGSRPQP